MTQGIQGSREEKSGEKKNSNWRLKKTAFQMTIIK